MRPRSRLLVKRGLPTIREGYEEMVQDMNQANSQHTPPGTQPQSLSTQDYLLSICQLARPTFPLREPDWDILSMAPMDMSKPCPRLHRHREPARPASPISTAHTQKQAKGEAPETKDEAPEASGCVPTEPVAASSAQSPVEMSSDPLEYLFSSRGSQSPQRLEERGCRTACRPRSGSFPRASALAPPAARRKSSCPELRLATPMPTTPPASTPDDSPASPATLTQRSPLTKKKHGADQRSLSAVAGSLAKSHSAPHAESRGKGGQVVDKNSMVSHWIAECRSAWREAMIHACMLPALAEK
ncbi:hypothetical protein ACEWY4_009947 [Coilia grayii]|uniref:Uncharacterized protein n=1 Tax=Coilia grayii TaxID=363190 RepID=A0ABD1K7V1_9TELE